MASRTGEKIAWSWVKEARRRKRGELLAQVPIGTGKKSKRVRDILPRVDALWTGTFSTLRPSEYGSKDFHGRFHPEIVAQAILRYIPEEQRKESLIWDPMAGGGTTGDVAREFGVACAMTDINPSRLDIRKFDATTGAEAAAEMLGGREVDLLILHPPYWSAVKYGTAGDLAETPGKFMDWFSHIALTTVPLVRAQGHVVFVIGSLYRDRELHPIDLYCLPILRSMGLVIKGRVAKDFGETKGGWKQRAALMKYRALKSGYWAYDWEQVFFLRKLGAHAIRQE